VRSAVDDQQRARNRRGRSADEPCKGDETMTVVREQAWFGGIFHPHAYGSHGLYRPEVAAWISNRGELLGALAAPPGHGGRALREALDAALRRKSVAKPTRLAVEQPELVDVLRPGSQLPVRHEKHWAFERVVDDHLDQIAGVGFTQGYVERGVTPALARELFLASDAFVASGIVELERPRLCAIDFEGLDGGHATIWIGSEPTQLGSGMRLFRDLELYRAYMRVRVVGDRQWTVEDDAAILGLGCEHLRFLCAKQCNDIRRYRLPLHAPDIAPVVIATDERDVPRPYGPQDVRAIILVLRAIVAAHASGQPSGRHRVRADGGIYDTQVWLEHPEAQAGDLALSVLDVDGRSAL
jgi:hypothetical protein